MSWKTFSAIGCTHGDRISRRDAEGFFKAIDDLKPQIRIHLGDLADFRNLRRGVDLKEECDDVGPDFFAAMSFLDRYRPNVLTLGNHDWRLWKMMRDARGIYRAFAEDHVKHIEKVCARIKCKVLPYDVAKGVWQLNELCPKFLHGYSAGVGSARQHAFVFGNCVIAHLHSPCYVRVERHGGAECHVLGGMPDDEEMHYARERMATLRWDPSWMYGLMNPKTGQMIPWHIRKIGDGKWAYPKTFSL
jgi:hypothetical protein